ncbi:MAG: hypothetical protein OYG32_14100 [Rhodospirillaceae bacterium]|nr:hypothetical protein [Rhodospirillaceae bacterium]
MTDTATKKKLRSFSAKPAAPEREPRETPAEEFMSVRSKTLSDHLHETTLGEYPWNSSKKPE